MTYRAQPEGLRGEMVYGSFPMRLGGLAVGVVACAFGLLMVVMAFDDALVSCDRDKDVCTYDGGREQARFALSEVKSVRVEIRKGSKNNETGQPHILLANDKRLSLKNTSVGAARDFQAAFEQARASNERRFSVPLHGQRLMALASLLFFAMGGYLLVHSTRGIGRIVLQLNAGVLHATRSIFGIPIKRWTVDARDIIDVQIQWSRLKEWWHRDSMPGSTAAQLLLITQKGAETALCEQAFRGYHLHLRAERQLRTLLDLPPLSASKMDMRAARAKEMQPPPAFGSGFGAAFMIVWMGMCCGSIAGIGLLGIIGIALGLFSARDNIEPWVMLVGGIGGAIGGVALLFWLRHRANTR